MQYIVFDLKFFAFFHAIKKTRVFKTQRNKRRPTFIVTFGDRLIRFVKLEIFNGTDKSLMWHSIEWKKHDLLSHVKLNNLDIEARHREEAEEADEVSVD